jgi:formamidopyrimidine-DNA glycosylase
MPELPDLQAFSRNLDKKLSGKKIKKISLPVRKALKQPAGKIKKVIQGSILKEIYREGKELRLLFSNKNIIGLHLMLHGKIFVFEEKNEEKYTIMEMVFEDGTGLVLTDYQKKATVTLNPEEKEAPDALSKELTVNYIKDYLAQKRSPVKKLLLDQHFIRGIGNAYADEILYDAGISPFSIGNKIPAGKIRTLLNSIRSVLKKAEKQILKEDPDIINGEIRDFLLIHNAERKKSPGGKKIRQTRLNSRTTYYTEEQEVYQ